MISDENGAVIVRSILAHKLGIQIVAKGVETLVIYSRLNSLSVTPHKVSIWVACSDDVLSYLYLDPQQCKDG